MINLQRISYCRIGTPDLDLATKFATAVLGLTVQDEERTATYFQSDERHHTLCYHLGRPQEQAIGFEVAPADLNDAADTLDKIGHSFRRGSREDCEARRVQDMVSFDDPSGNRIELVVRPLSATSRYHGSRDAGITGFSHVGLFSTNVVRDEAFWTQVCNARVSDRLDDAPLLRISSVHHSIAVLPRARPGIHHINHQVASTDDVQRSLHVLRKWQRPIVFGPGRHPASTAQFLYFSGPDDLVFEYSTGVMEIADEPLYRERQLPATPKGACGWGAIPQFPQ